MVRMKDRGPERPVLGCNDKDSETLDVECTTDPGTLVE